MDKPKNTNFKWPKHISRYFVSYLADQARAGLKVDKSFKGAAMTAATKAVNEKFPHVTVTETNCLNHYRTLKGRWIIIKRIKELSGVSWDDATKTILMGEDQYQSYIAAHPSAEPFINKPIEQYEEMSLVCGDDYATGSFARSFGEPLGSTMFTQGDNGIDGMDLSHGSPLIGPSSSTGPSRKSGSKRPRSVDDEIGLGICRGLDNLAKAVEGQEWTNALFASVMELKDEFPLFMLDRALMYLVTNHKVGQLFMARDLELRKVWLQYFFEENP